VRVLRYIHESQKSVNNDVHDESTQSLTSVLDVPRSDMFQSQTQCLARNPWHKSKTRRRFTPSNRWQLVIVIKVRISFVVYRVRSATELFDLLRHDSDR